MADVGAAESASVGIPQDGDPSKGRPDRTGKTGSRAGGSGGASPAPPPAGVPSVTDAVTDAAAAGETKDKADDGAEDDVVIEGRRHRQFQEIIEVGQSILKSQAHGGEYRTKLATGEDLTQEEMALSFYDQLDSGEFRRRDDKGKSVVIERDAEGYYLSQDGKSHEAREMIGGNPIIMPELANEDYAGKKEVILEAGAQLARILALQNGKYVCEFAYPGTGDTMVDGDGDPIQLALSRKFIADLQIASEIDIYRQIAPENKAYQTYLDTITTPYEDFVPSDNMDAILEQGGAAAGLPTREAVAGLLEYKYPDESSRPPEVVTLLAALDAGGVVLKKEDFSKAMKLAGVGSGVFDEEMDRLIGELKGAGENKDLIKQLENQINLLNKVKKAWVEAEGRGSSPVDQCYEQMRNGTMNFGSLAEAIKGNPQDLIKFFNENPALGASLKLSEDEQRKLVSLIKDHKKGLFWTLIVALGIPVAVALGGAAASVGIVNATTGLTKQR